MYLFNCNVETKLSQCEFRFISCKYKSILVDKLVTVLIEGEEVLSLAARTG